MFRLTVLLLCVFVIFGAPVDKVGEKGSTAVEKPKTETPKVEAEAPKKETEAPKKETEAPKAEAPKTEAPKAESPKTETPKTAESVNLVAADSQSDVITYTKTIVADALVSGTFTNFNKDDPVKQANSQGIPNPVIFMGPLTFNGGNPAVLRANRTSTGFDVTIHEPPCYDMIHMMEEAVDYLIVNEDVEDGVFHHAFTRRVPPLVETVIDLPQTYPSAPVCFVQIQSQELDGFMNAHIVSTTTTTATVVLDADKQDETGFIGSGKDELVGFLCVPQPDSGNTYTLPNSYSSALTMTLKTYQSDDDNDKTVNLGSSTRAIATIQTKEGEPTNIRSRGDASSSPVGSNNKIVLALDEDNCKANGSKGGSRVHHRAETVAVLGW